ncbi:transcriptional regulator [[Phormidium ambiguum] IAM M-71]|jgi:HTH-type transcriptional regulator/antitoxin HigA|uniref:Transcriptional regulator n=1 Tax=[Phormidium ambiguum] IAM M-71 TaxID=454136 RepID=A0A1U7I989_9CYAN|nr:transcriptional regulator [Phormidium ambiguum]OKH33058.1 transcriptional regulator [Phormidium ambiguum IAM M-71]
MTSTINKEEYTRLLAETLPRVIHTEDEHKRLVKEVEKLMDLGEELTDEQAELFDLLVTLIEQYEDKHYQLKTATPHEILNELMLAKDLKQKDLIEVFGSKGITSEVINGKRSISKNQAKALGKFFHVSPALFL